MTVIERTNDLQDSTEQMLHDTSGLFFKAKAFSVDNQQLILFMLNVLKFNPDIASFFLAIPPGNLVLVRTLELSSQTHYFSEPNQLIPPSSAYLVKVTNMSTSNPYAEIWYYKDTSFKTVGSEKFKQPNIDIKTRPWYNGALQTKNLYWTDVYHFLSTNDPGLTASKPIYNDKNKLIGILGADLSFVGLSNFLKRQDIGKSGHAFITDSHGQLLIPEPQDIPPESKISIPIIRAATDHFRATNEHNFLFEFENTKYLAFVSSTTQLFNKDWLIVTIVPFADFFIGLIKAQFEILLITLCILLISILIIVYFSKRISKPIVKLAKEIDKITNLDFSSGKKIHSYILEIRMMVASVTRMKAAIRSFIRYVPKEIVKQLLSQGNEIALHVEKKNLTIFFSDIQNFTSIAEKYPLNMLMPLLNEYFDGLSKIILLNRGTIDKYIGDSIMAFWGAPLPIPNHPIFACKAALQCQAFLVEFNKKCKANGKPELITRFGISIGNVVVGNIGTIERMNYTVIGDAVNTAARLQLTDKIYHVTIIISDGVYKQKKNQFLVRPLDTVEVRGKQDKIKIYELVAWLGADPQIGATTAQTELCQLFTQAYQTFVAGDYTAAHRLFTAIHAKFPDDYPTTFYLARLEKLQKPHGQVDRV